MRDGTQEDGEGGGRRGCCRNNRIIPALGRRAQRRRRARRDTSSPLPSPRRKLRSSERFIKISTSHSILVQLCHPVIAIRIRIKSDPIMAPSRSVLWSCVIPDESNPRSFRITHLAPRSQPGIVSPEIERITLHNPIAFTARAYAAPFLCESSSPPFRPAEMVVTDPFLPCRHRRVQLSTPCSTLPIITVTTNGSNLKNGHSSTASSSVSVTP